ncbi:MAG: zinc-ribbon domain-containing protein [Candidatus Binataceae bacterium]
MLRTEAEFDCRKCGRTIPSDSRFCSFCGAEVSFAPLAAPAGASADHEAATVLLSVPPAGEEGARSAPHGAPVYRRTRGARRPILVLVLIFVGAFAAVRAISCLNVVGGGTDSGANPPDATRADAPAPGMPAPEAEPGAPAPDSPPSEFRAARLDAFRAALDAGGLTGVHFRMVGDTMVLTGTVPTATDEAMVQMLALNVAGVVSLKDNMRVQSGAP